MSEGSTTDNQPDIELQVDWHLLQRVYGNEALSCLFTLIAAGVLAAVVAAYAAAPWVPAAWWCSMAALCALRINNARRFRSKASPESLTAWRRRHIYSLAATGGAWGCGGAFMFLSTSMPQSQAAILIVIAAMTAAAAAHQGAVIEAFGGYLLAAILPIATATAFNPRGDTLGIALLCVVFGVAMWIVATRYNRDQRANLRLGFEMREMSEQFAIANRKLEADIDARLRAENLLSTERNVLENVARQMSLEKILDELNLDVEALFPGSLCTILLLDPDTGKVKHGSAPKLPDSFINAVNGLDIGPYAGSCGTAMYRGEQVIVEDIAEDPLWRGYRPLALDHGLRACWSTPIISRAGRVLGSFAIYRREPGTPSVEELETVSRMSRLIALVIEDIQNSEKIQLSEQRFRDFANTAADWFWEMDARLEYTYVSEKNRDTRDWPQDLIMSRTRETLATRIEHDRAHVDHVLNFEFSIETPDGDIEILSVAKPLCDRDGVLTGWRGVGRDITRERQLEREIRYQAAHDSLTGLANRREFERRIREILGKKDEGRDEYVAFIDLDQFKIINDSAGHPAGDAVLKRVAAVLLDAIPGEHIVARLGGDEFGVSFSAADPQTAVTVMEDLVRILYKTRFEWGNTSFRLGASVGLVRVTGTYKSTAQVLSDVDTCCYRAKNQGGNRVSLFQPDLDLFTDDARSTGELLRALKDSRALVHVQKIQALQQPERIPWYEVLLRYNAGGDAVSSPSRLIPAAERYGQMGVVDTWVLEQVLSHWNELLARGAIRLSLNLSASSIAHQETAAEITRLVEQAHVSPGALCFEITETSVVDSLGGAAQFMRDLRGLGCSFMIDNFGGGQSNFSYLKALPGDYLAIDGGYVRTMTADPANHAIVDAIHKVGRAHGMRTVAKYVESSAALDALIELGVDFAQGHYIGKAIPASELELSMAADTTRAGGAV